MMKNNQTNQDTKDNVLIQLIKFFKYMVTYDKSEGFALNLLKFIIIASTLVLVVAFILITKGW